MGSWAELTAKKTIGAKHRTRMAENEFNGMFGEVEIDDSYCLDNFMYAEIDFEHIFKKLNLNRKQFARKLTFRVRKIKARNVAGRYYPTHRTLVCDVKNLDAFIHELGHLMDYEWNGTGLKADMLCLQQSFKPVMLAYIAHYHANAHSRMQHKYYLNATEIFARSFELYIARKFGDVVINESLASYSTRGRKAIYPTDNKMYLLMADLYFDKLFAL